MMSPGALPARQRCAGLSSRPAAITAVGIVIPARNEQVQLGRCLDAITAAIAHLHRTQVHSVSVRTVVVLDSCIDRTADVVARYRAVEGIAAQLGSVGAARALGAQTVLPMTALHRLWLANTDADSAVPVDWLSHMLEQARLGSDLVLGTVTPDDLLPDGVRRAWVERHVSHDGHPHVHGANLGIRASAYRKVGGWPQLRSGEDVGLVAAAELDPTVCILRSGAIPVVTSARLAGRAPQGFAHYLQRLGDDPKGTAVHDHGHFRSVQTKQRAMHTMESVEWLV